MFWAIKNNKKIEASPNKTAECPICSEQVIAKCGTIMVWHWAHKSKSDCDSWSEGETQWHIDWKNEYDKKLQEVVVEDHRADIKLKNGKVIELQNSPISAETINERELFYKDMIWLINGKSLASGLILRNKPKYCTFRWKHPAKSLWVCNKELYIDISHYGGKFNNIKGDILFVKKIHNEVPCGGWGFIMSREDFLNKFK